MFIDQCTGFWNCITPDAWLQGIGTLIGALLGASFGSLGSYLFFRAKLKEQEKQLTQDFKKEYKNIDRMLKILIERMENLYKYWDDKIKNSFYKNTDLKFLKRATKELNSIPNSIIPVKFFDAFETIQYELGGMEATVWMYYELNGLQNDIDLENRKDFRECLDKVIKNRDVINSEL